MSTQDAISRQNSVAIPNGSGAAAILSAGIGSFAVAVLTIAADKSVLVKNLLMFYKPTGPLSGVTTGAIVLWLVAWAILDWCWRKETLPLKTMNLIAFVLLGLSLLLTFPPLGELL